MAAKRAKANRTGQETTHQQSVSISMGTPELRRDGSVTYKTYREIRKHPTVALARALAIAPVLAAEWAYECDDGVDDKLIELIQSELKKPPRNDRRHGAARRL